MLDQILGSDVYDNIVEEMFSSITNQFQWMSKSLHNLLKKKRSYCQGIILHGGSSFHPLSNIICSQNDVSPLPSTDQIDRPDKVNTPFFKWSKEYDRSKRPMVLERRNSCPLALITFPNISLDISDQIRPPVFG